MQEGGLNDIPTFEGYTPAHQNKKNGRKGDDPQSADLKKDNGDNLAREGQVLPDIQHGQSRYTDRRCWGEQGIDKTKGVLGGGEGQGKERSSDENQPDKTQDEYPLRGQDFWKKGFNPEFFGEDHRESFIDSTDSKKDLLKL